MIASLRGSYIIPQSHDGIILRLGFLRCGAEGILELQPAGVIGNVQLLGRESG